MGKNWAVWLLCLLLFSGCSRPFERTHNIEKSPVGLPEQIFIAPDIKYMKNLRVGVIPFDTPLNNAQLSRKAASLLTQTLLEKKVFGQIELALDQAPPSRNDWRALARKRAYSLILLGEINSMMAGSEFETTRVEITLRAVEFTKTKEITRWYAKATEVVKPKSSFDLFLIKAKRAPAPPMDAVLRRNLKKFANLFLAAGGTHELK